MMDTPALIKTKVPTACVWAGYKACKFNRVFNVNLGFVKVWVPGWIWGTVRWLVGAALVNLQSLTSIFGSHQLIRIVLDYRTSTENSSPRSSVIILDAFTLLSKLNFKSDAMLPTL